MASDENLLKQIIGLYLKITYKDVLLVILRNKCIDKFAIV